MDLPEITWPDRLTISWAKQLAKKINTAMGIGHSRSLHIVAVRYGFRTWIACRQALETDVERADKLNRNMRSQQRQATKWAAGNAQRRVDIDAMAKAEPGWVGKPSAVGTLDSGMRPADRTAATVVFHAQAPETTEA